MTELYPGEWFCIGMRSDKTLSGELAGPFSNERAAAAWSDNPPERRNKVLSESWVVFCVTHRP